LSRVYFPWIVTYYFCTIFFQLSKHSIDLLHDNILITPRTMTFHAEAFPFRAEWIVLHNNTVLNSIPYCILTMLH
jgi:hypothetical protein